MTSQTLSCEDGQNVEESLANAFPAENVSTSETTSSSFLATQAAAASKRKRSSTRESAPRTKKKISSAKSGISNTATPPTASSATSVQASTSSAGDCKPFWNLYSNALSKRLWLPSEIDSAALPSNYLNPSSKAMACDSWFTVAKKQVEVNKNLPRTFYLSSTSSSPATTAEEPQKTEGNDKDKNKKKKDLVAKKIKLEPTSKQRATLRRWCGVYRWTYNECVRLCCITKDVKYSGKNRTKKELRALVANSKSAKVEERPWLLEVPYDVRDGAISEFVKNLMTEMDKIKEKPSHRFRMNFKTKQDSSMSLPILKKHWKNGQYFPRFLPGKLKGFEEIPMQLECDSKLVKTRTNDFFICLPTTRPDSSPAPCAYKGSCIALDPGVRTFLTGYDPSGTILEIGKSDVDKVFKMCYRIDRIMAKVAKAKNHKQRYQRKRAACRARTKLQNCINDMHSKAAKYLCESYELIFLPKFTTHQMVRRATRKIRGKTARAMLTFAHYKFRQRLLDKARNYDNVQVVIVNEAYTSKTCTKCGVIKTNLGGAKTFKCSSCDWKGDRDINGARNIYIRSVIEAGSLVILPEGPTPPAIYSFGASREV